MTSKAMVMRMDLIPETEQLHILKVGLLGLPYSRLVNIKNLEKIDYQKDTSYPFRWFKSIIWIPKEEKNMIYRDIESDEIYSFSPNGDWSQEGLDHELLN